MNTKAICNILLLLLILTIFNVRLGSFSYIEFGIFVLICIWGFFSYTTIPGVKTAGIGKFFVLFLIANVASWYLSEKTLYSIGANGYYLRNTTQLLTPTIKFCLIFFPFFYFTYKNAITKKSTTIFLCVFYALAFFDFFSGQSVLSESDSRVGSSNNAAYMFLSVLPLVIMTFDKKRHPLILLASLLIIVICAKRGAIMGIFATVLIYLLFYFKEHRLKTKYIVAAIILLVVAYYGVMMLYESNANLQLKMEATSEGENSGRDIIYEALWLRWLGGTTMQKIFGIEYMEAARFYGLDAHNDWLEILLSCGLMGAIFYLGLFISVLRYGYVNKNVLDNNQKFVLYSSLIIWFIKSCVSMGYTVPADMLYVISIAVVMGQCEYNKKYLRI